jgi:hypothetical protein
VTVFMPVMPVQWEGGSRGERRPPQGVYNPTGIGAGFEVRRGDTFQVRLGVCGVGWGGWGGPRGGVGLMEYESRRIPSESAGLAGALGGADQRPSPRAPERKRRPAPRAP